jgi:hypothetical protein
VSTDPLYYDLIVATLLAGNVQARKIGNDSFDGIEVKADEGVRIIWGNNVGQWGWTSVTVDGDTRGNLTDVSGNATAERVANLIATTDYGLS